MSEGAGDRARLAAVRALRTLDVGTAALEDVVTLAAEVCGRGAAAVTLVDDERTYFLAEVGVGVREIPNDASFCAHAVRAGEELMQVVDARGDERLAETPIVAAGSIFRAYAGVLLTQADGQPVGTLCVLDRSPGELTSSQCGALAALARLVVHLLAGGRARVEEDAPADTEPRRARPTELGRHETQAALDAIVTVDRWQRIVSWNEGATVMFGHPTQDAIGQHLSLVVPPDQREAHQRGFERLLAGGEPVLIGQIVEVEAMRADGGRLPVELALSQWSTDGAPFFTAVMRDISARRAAESERLRLATHDPDTGLPYIAALRSWNAIDDGARGPRRIVVFALELRGLSAVCSTLSPAASADLLGQIGATLGGLRHDGVLVSDLGGDHFAGTCVPNREARDDVAFAHGVAESVVDAAVGPYTVDGVVMELNAQIGVVATISERPVEHLVRRAEAVVATAVRRITVVTTDTAPAGVVPGALDDAAQAGLVAALRAAIPAGQLELHYQPIVASTGPSDVVLVEALVRWNHPERGLLSPAAFIDTAERSAVITPLTRWVLDEACRQQTRWQRIGITTRVSVNLSAQVIVNDDALAMIASSLRRTGCPPHGLKIEITESAILADPQAARALVQALRERGVEVAIDDFGTGFTSLGMLRTLPVDTLKLDRSFVAGVTVGTADAAIARAVVDLAHELGIAAVAEGVEDGPTRDQLIAFGYDQLQGYLFSRPVPAGQIPAWVAARRVAERARRSA